MAPFLSKLDTLGKLRSLLSVKVVQLNRRIQYFLPMPLHIMAGLPAGIKAAGVPGQKFAVYIDLIRD